jgi:hypothetical protein
MEPIAQTQAGNEKTLEHFCSRVCRLVRLAGIEPTTPWFVAKYSIQLSYSREASYSIPSLDALTQLSANGRKKTHNLAIVGFYIWCGWQELNPRPLGS